MIIIYFLEIPGKLTVSWINSSICYNLELILQMDNWTLSTLFLSHHSCWESNLLVWKTLVIISSTQNLIFFLAAKGAKQEKFRYLFIPRGYL